MIKYIMTSPQLDGEIEFHFSHTGYLQQLIFRCQPTDKQYEYLWKHQPYTRAAMDAFVKATPYAHFVISVCEITFDDFWNRYGEKEHSSKKKAQLRWNNMPKSAQIRAYEYIPKYKYNLPPGVRMKYAETYLNSEIWEK